MLMWFLSWLISLSFPILTVYFLFNLSVVSILYLALCLIFFAMVAGMAFKPFHDYLQNQGLEKSKVVGVLAFSGRCKTRRVHFAPVKISGIGKEKQKALMQEYFRALKLKGVKTIYAETTRNPKIMEILGFKKTKLRSSPLVHYAVACAIHHEKGKPFKKLIRDKCYLYKLSLKDFEAPETEIEGS